MRACGRCAAPIEENLRGRRRIYCVPCAGIAKAEKTAAWADRYRGRESEIPLRNRSDPLTKAKRKAFNSEQQRLASQAMGCRVCGGSLSGMQTLYCSPQCCNKVACEKRKPSRIELTCLECAERFMQARPYQKFCSLKCTRRARDRIFGSRRRGRYVEGEKVDPIKVFERDGWRCRECRCSTPRSLRGSTGPRAPELDHIVSVADGCVPWRGVASAWPPRSPAWAGLIRLPGSAG